MASTCFFTAPYIDLNQGRHLVDMVFETVCLKKMPRNEKLRISVNVMNHHEYVLGSSWKSSSSLSTFELNFEKACRLMIEYGDFAMEAAAASHVCSCQENCEEHQEITCYSLSSCKTVVI